MKIKNINPQYNIIHIRISRTANNKKISNVKNLELFHPIKIIFKKKKTSHFHS